ncbi:MAG TPA: hypothetical protein VJ831_03305 [Jatrophihabitantaceae bacterium]|nr:hypothetical protein [Jatrophihabitantaceae bacterium]
MKGVHYALRRIHDGESDLVLELSRVAARQRVDHEIHHVARDLANWSREHVRLIADFAQKVDLDLDGEANDPTPLATALREAMSSAMGRRPEPGLLLLHDLEQIYVRASENSLRWEELAQVAQAKKMPDLLELATRCHPQNLRQVRWANTMIKTHSPQILASL